MVSYYHTEYEYQYSVQYYLYVLKANDVDPK